MRYYPEGRMITMTEAQRMIDAQVAATLRHVHKRVLAMQIEPGRSSQDRFMFQTAQHCAAAIVSQGKK